MNGAQSLEERPGFRPTLTLLVFVALLLAAQLVGCAQTSVQHLKRQPWLLNKPQSLDAKFWRFTFDCLTQKGQLGVRGVAMPVASTIPDWATRIDELWLAVYLNDANGRVLAKNLLVLLPRELDRKNGVSFEFLLEPEDIGQSEHLFVTFGYRMVLSDGQPAQEGKTPRIFFANEGAVTKF